MTSAGYEVPAQQRWASPWWLIHQVEEWALEKVTLDAAAERFSAKASWWFGPGSPFGEDGLAQAWPQDGLIWVNPPYDSIGPWVARALHHTGNCPRSRVVLLVPARTDQVWWHDLHVSPRARCCCLRPRVAFEAAGGVRASSPTFATVLWELTQRPHALPRVHVWR